MGAQADARPDAGEEQDGRRRRSAASKLKIVDAMIEIVRSGETSPSAEQVADQAGVGRRTVFRLFKDMDSIYSEMNATMRQRLIRILDIPIAGESPAERLSALVDRRTKFFEETLPIAFAAAVHRPKSAFLQAQHAEVSAELRSILAAHLPPEAVDDPACFEALDMILSIESWQRLRLSQKLSVPDAIAAMKRAALATLKG